MQAYTEFEWQTEAAGNGASGEKLTNVFVELVKKLDGVRSICDLGCGNGHISGRLAALGYAVTGVDASASGSRDRLIRMLSLLTRRLIVISTLDSLIS
jgi:SAM-dependent methyltransferase